ncbi:MAG: F0F1 ATP synthase subunit A [Patescibacteria group bacterium]
MQKSINNSSTPLFAIVPLAAEPIAHLGAFPITNAMVNAWIVAVFFAVIAFVVSRRTSLVPRGIQNVIESIIEILLNEVEKVTSDKKKARQFFPLIATIFLVVLANNWLGLIPGTGTIGIYGLMHGDVELIPLLRPAGSDLNFTAALAITAVFFSHFVGVRTFGVFEYFSKFLNFKGIWKSFKHGPMAIMTSVVEFGVGVLEIVGEIAKVLSLSLRLFGNVLAGEILMTVMLGLVAFVMPIPFTFLEILVGIVQATVFAMLTLVYLVIASSPHGEHEEAHA